MSKTYKLAPIIRASMKLLAKNYQDTENGKNIFSCVCVEDYIFDILQTKNKLNYDEAEKLLEGFYDFAQSLGCKTGSTDLFNKYYEKKEIKNWVGYYETKKVISEKSQGIRYAWMNLCATIAEEENVKVKI